MNVSVCVYVYISACTVCVYTGCVCTYGMSMYIDGLCAHIPCKGVYARSVCVSFLFLPLSLPPSLHGRDAVEIERLRET